MSFPDDVHPHILKSPAQSPAITYISLISSGFVTSQKIQLNKSFQSKLTKNNYI